jgi:chemotaxis protein methyltransferase CheR
MNDARLNENEFNLFKTYIYQLTGISLGPAKRDLVQSRLQKRLRENNITDYKQYFDYISSDNCPQDEIESFINCITTNTTSFFREKHHFDFIEQTVIPNFIKDLRPGDPKPCLSIWHAGCSTGEEPYSLAMVLAKCQQLKSSFTYKQLATDIDTNVLEQATNAIYEDEKIEGIPSAFKSFGFLRGKGEKCNLYKVRRELRENLTFRQLNLLSENWPMSAGTKFDMIWCRNVVIYFDKPTQRVLFARFAERLKPGGYLFIGHSESLLGVTDLFESVGQTIYRLKASSLQRAA